MVVLAHHLPCQGLRPVEGGVPGSPTAKSPSEGQQRLQLWIDRRRGPLARLQKDLAGERGHWRAPRRTLPPDHEESRSGSRSRADGGSFRLLESRFIGLAQISVDTVAGATAFADEGPDA